MNSQPSKQPVRYSIETITYDTEKQLMPTERVVRDLGYTPTKGRDSNVHGRPYLFYNKMISSGDNIRNIFVIITNHTTTLCAIPCILDKAIEEFEAKAEEEGLELKLIE